MQPAAEKSQRIHDCRQSSKLPLTKTCVVNLFRNRRSPGGSDAKARKANKQALRKPARGCEQSNVAVEDNSRPRLQTQSVAMTARLEHVLWGSTGLINVTFTLPCDNPSMNIYAEILHLWKMNHQGQSSENVVSRRETGVYGVSTKSCSVCLTPADKSARKSCWSIVVLIVPSAC